MSAASSEWLSGWRLRLLILSIVAAAIGYVGFSVWGGWQQVSSAIGRIGAGMIVLALMMSLVNYGLRLLRWGLYLQQLGYRVPVATNVRIYLAGFALTTTPAKAGEALRALLLKPLGVRYADSLSALLSERISDLLAVLAMAAVGISQYPHYSPLLWLFAIMIPLFWILLASKTLLEYGQQQCRFLPSRLANIGHKVFNLLMSTRRCHPPHLLLQASALSLAAWCAEGMAFYWILQQLQADISVQTALFIYAISMLAGAASFMPGGLGGAELAMTGLLHLNGLPLPDAIAASLVIRLATLWFAVVLGGIALLLEPAPQGSTVVPTEE
ncbi:lysylphosphatidylglycerol synthase transmembrane domain-containing protein [Parathalassolituus penaei]|uniref:Lysylphosphatidylglycerol synthase transmembrane domain-containing protein n=1 Tax=Parathalassolituus penaei TaxID=2997323 RepID=A0A9X3EL50_9GAMM|nr:lysylphosphatidylglycerol synthase transmembrane domain-containing protein [Parathalassolituus penaei]MCY0966361.1 lysylphosphatidylglycerol synthase transmembrane domain-containing protein [Parathalassolituus penaei]